jgi:putative ABC transport system permease protein
MNLRIAAASMRVGMDALRVNLLRTTLSMLGVIIGVGALVAVLSIGDGVEEYIREQIANKTSVQAIQVAARTSEIVDGYRLGREDHHRFSQEEVLVLRGILVDSGDASLNYQQNTRINVPDGAPHATAVVGMTPHVLPYTDSVVGRLLTVEDVEHNAPVVVLWDSASALLFPDNQTHEETLGSRVEINGVRREVIGVFIHARSGPPGALIPITGIPEEAEPSLMIIAESIEAVEPVRVSVERWLSTLYDDWESEFRVVTSRGNLAEARKGMLIFKLTMGSITSISILVGGIGIMNILLASVTERTREIGIRKATGATRADIVVQFLAESVTISLFGSVLGLALGWAVASLSAAVMRTQTEALVSASYSGGTMLAAAVAAIIVGVTFGTYPALRAARLSPIDAIRHE